VFETAETDSQAIEQPDQLGTLDEVKAEADQQDGSPASRFWRSPRKATLQLGPPTWRSVKFQGEELVGKTRKQMRSVRRDLRAATALLSAVPILGSQAGAPAAPHRARGRRPQPGTPPSSCRFRIALLEGPGHLRRVRAGPGRPGAGPSGGLPLRRAARIAVAPGWSPATRGQGVGQFPLSSPRGSQEILSNEE